MTIRHSLFIATAFVASLAMQAPVVAQTQIAPVKVFAQIAQPKCSNCSDPLMKILQSLLLSQAVYKITYGAITLANTAGPCLDECASNVAFDFALGAFSLLGALI